nr:MAG TPA: hypothetical protein [Caudoviricetes sp.]
MSIKNPRGRQRLAPRGHGRMTMRTQLLYHG